MRKNITILVSIILMLSLVACSNHNSNTISCNNCNESISINAKFCQTCGTAVDEVNTNVNNKNTENNNSPAINQQNPSENPEKLPTIVEYDFIDYTEFSEYWFDGTFRCGTDFIAGDYYILPLFGAGAMYDVCNSPNDFSWSNYRMLRKITVKEGQYVNVGHGAIMVSADEVDTSNWSKYGVFLVGKDILAGEYKLETISDEYSSDLYSITGIDGAYQLNDNDLEETPTESNYLFENQKYIILENGQYIIITNIKLTNVNVSAVELSEQPSKDSSTEANDEDVIQDSNSSDDSNSDNTTDAEETFISNGRFTFTPRSFIKLFDEADKKARGYNYTYMRMNGETSLFYELAEISGGYENVRSVGMVSFVKDIDTTLTIEEDYTENIITKINVLVEDVDDVPAILVGCMCAADPALDFTTAYNVGMDVIEQAGTEEGYTHNGVNYVVAGDGEYYYIIITIATNNTVQQPVVHQPAVHQHTYSNVSCTEDMLCTSCGEIISPLGHNWHYETDTPVTCERCSMSYPCNVSFTYSQNCFGVLEYNENVRIDAISLSPEVHYSEYGDEIYVYILCTIQGYNSSIYSEPVIVEIGDRWDFNSSLEFYVPSGDFVISDWTILSDIYGNYYLDGNYSVDISTY